MEANHVQHLVQIERLNRKGRGVGCFQRTKTSLISPVEVIGAIPGDSVLVECRSKRRGRSQGDLKEIVSPSSARVPLRCSHAPSCGGCSLQQMDYQEQLKAKQSMIHTLFAPLFQLDTDLRSIIPCDDPWKYRNKMEFSFSQNRQGDPFLGLMLAGSRGKVFNLSECHLAPTWMVDVLGAVSIWWKESGLQAYRMNDTGSLRTLTLRYGIATGDKMVILTVSGNPEYALKQTQLNGLIQAIQAVIPQEQWDRLSLFLKIQQIQKGVPTQFYEIHLSGPDHLIEKLKINVRGKVINLQFKISPTSFFQPNTLQAEKLYGAALSLVSSSQHVLDLYAGTATLGQVMALQAKRVTSIEINPHAIFDAQSNKELNQIDHLYLECGDVGKTLDRLASQEDFIPPDLVIIDPPRSGLDPLAMTQIVKLKPEQILYISCNPLSQAENVKFFIDHGYCLNVIQPVDQFPHTIHIENIILLNALVKDA